jgi:DNA-binding transcriptional ArsR family regulator
MGASPAANDNGLDTCAVQCIHPQVIQTALAAMPEGASLEQLAEFYKLFADGTRLRILAALSTAELCVCDLGALLDLKQPAVSHQLRILRQSRVVNARREGRVVYYSLHDHHIAEVIRVGLEHLAESRPATGGR